MFDKAEIKRRFEMNDAPIDRHGNFVYIGQDFYVTGAQIQALAHYHLLAGMSDADLLVALRNGDLSDFEAKYILKNSKEFIRDVLELDLDALRSSKTSTAELCGQLVVQVIKDLNATHEKMRLAPIEVNGDMFQADAKSREVILGYILTEREVDYWVVYNNEQIPMSLDALREVYKAIVARDEILHKQITDLKTEGRIYSEKRMYAQLVELSERVKAM